MTNLAGLHDRESTALGIRDTWALDTIALSENPAPPTYDPAYAWITRLNWGYGSTGTLPRVQLYGDYASRAAGYVKGSQNCHRWVVGNEPNLSREWPDNQPIMPWQYADCYGITREYIHGLPGHEQDEVLIAASGPWNAELKYEGNPNGDWIKYFEDVIKACGNDIDGFSIHSYCHGYNVALVTSSARMQPPFQSRHYEFKAYQDYMEAIPERLRHLPVYLTEANGNGPWQAVGLMPAMLGEINAWNKAGNQPIRAVIFYRYPRYDDFYIEGKADVISEYQAAVGRGYLSSMGTMTQTHLPAISPGTPAPQPTLPPLPKRDWDERLTQRGVTVETPQVAPGQRYWRVAKARWYDEAESQGRHHIYVEALEDNGKPIEMDFAVFWPDDVAYGETNGRSGFDAGNFPMSPSRNEFSVRIDTSAPSETLKGIGMGAETPGGFNAGIHTSTGVVFQLATMPAAVTPPPDVVGDAPTPPPPPPAKVPQLTHPIQDPALRIISQRFGENPQNYAQWGMAGHTGIDYAVPEGTHVVAVDDGQIIEAQYDEDGYGTYVKIRHAWGESLYAHLKHRVTDLRPIRKGELIGMSGNTGNSTGPHLHFAIRINPYQRGAPFDGYSDPLPYLGTPPVTKPTPITQVGLTAKGAIYAAAIVNDFDWPLLASLAWAESSWREKAVSDAGAMGILQIMPATWAEWAPRVDPPATDPLNDAQNLSVGIAYLKWLLSQTNGNVWNALVAYNWGIGNVLSGAPIPDESAEFANKVLHGRDLLKAVGAK